MISNLELINEFGEDKITKRIQYLYVMYRKFISDSSYTHKTTLSAIIIEDVICSYFHDIKRLKLFHEIDKINNIKISAYTGYWVNKLKPIQIIDKSPSPNFNNINSSFSHYIMMSICFDRDKVKFLGVDELKQLTLFYDTLLYSLHYRDINAKSLELTMSAFITKRSYYEKPIS